ncbi:pirin-like C-terminal cupin domain-containing protein [Rubripirellula lacrimiformis]|uniref:pirin-like C-terminal cupin domain-containing protein n=1 Tax=Rubripirellula lacrimiformis TaxID=1930273 RepID=UPI0011A96A47|nr:pirin-like C-terminal cupin domain-containing protein [Rubripirellula lacrimiformis]
MQPLAAGSGDLPDISTFSPMDVWDLYLKAGKRAAMQVPVGRTSVVVAQSGRVSVNGSPMKAVELALLDRDGDMITIDCETESQVLVLTGQTLGEPVVGQGPFVMAIAKKSRTRSRTAKLGKSAISIRRVSRLGQFICISRRMAPSQAAVADTTSECQLVRASTFGESARRAGPIKNVKLKKS